MQGVAREHAGSLRRRRPPASVDARWSGCAAPRDEARLGTNWMSADAPAAALIAIVRTKSTISAPMGMNA
jgi:hypothetical protein